MAKPRSQIKDTTTLFNIAEADDAKTSPFPHKFYIPLCSLALRRGTWGN